MEKPRSPMDLSDKLPGFEVSIIHYNIYPLGVWADALHGSMRLTFSFFYIKYFKFIFRLIAY